MNRKSIISALLALGAISASGQINLPQSTGYQARAAAMLSQGNFRGCIDQCNAGLELADAPRQQLLWLRAVAAFNGGYAEAKSLLAAYVGQFPAAPNVNSARLMLATITFYDKDYRAALAQFEAIDPQSLTDDQGEDLTYRKAYCLMMTREFEKAVPLMQALSATKRYGDSALFYEAYMAFVDGEYQYALDLFEKCDRTKAPGDMADYYVAQILFRQARYADALNLLMPLMARHDVDPEFSEEINRIAGECFYALGDDNRAMVYLNPYMAAHPDDAPLSTRYIVGVERYQTGDYDEALELLAPVSSLTEQMGQSASLTMGQCYLAKGNTKSALMMFDKAAALDLNPTITELAYYNYAVAQVDGGRLPFANSVQTLENFIKRYPNSRYANTVREYLVKGYIATNDYEGALRSLQAMKGVNTPVVDQARQQVNFVLGTRALQAGNPAKAISYLKDAEKYASANGDIAHQTALWLGDALYASGDYGHAASQYRKYLNKATKNDVNRSTAQYNLAYALFGSRNYPEARTAFQTVVKDKHLASEIAADSYNRIGDTYYYQKQLQEAKRAYRSAYDADRRSADYSLLQIAMIDGHLGQHAEKLQSLDELIAKYPGSALRPTAMTEKALAYVVTSKTKNAVEVYKQLLASYPQTSHGRNALLQLAILSDNIGDQQAALGYYRRVVSEYPTSSEAALAVDDMKRIYGDKGSIDELNSFLESIQGAPQLDATERNAIAAAGLLRKAKAASTADSRLAAANEMLTKYPDADGIEDALQIAAAAYMELGISDKALTTYAQLITKAPNDDVRHSARMGMLRAAVDMDDNSKILDVTADILGNPVIAGSDIPEVKFARASALKVTGHVDEALTIWEELSASTSTLYGVRSAFELADHDFAAGKLPEASQRAEAIIDANPPHPYWLARTFILYSDILRAQGSDFEADEYLRVLRSNYPGNEPDIFRMIDKRLPQ